jgi:hypothetical protein
MFSHHHLMAAMLAVTLSGAPTSPAASVEVAAVPAGGNRLTETWEKWLRTSDHLVLMATDPLALRDYSDAKRDALGRGERLDIRGRLELTDPAQRVRVAEAVIADIAAAKSMDLFCFNPRHEITATKDGKVLTLVICYQCLAVQVYEEGKDRVKYTLSGTSAPEVNRLLTAAGISLVK